MFIEFLFQRIKNINRTATVLSCVVDLVSGHFACGLVIEFPMLGLELFAETLQ